MYHFFGRPGAYHFTAFRAISPDFEFVLYILTRAHSQFQVSVYPRVAWLQAALRALESFGEKARNALGAEAQQRAKELEAAMQQAEEAVGSGW